MWPGLNYPPWAGQVRFPDAGKVFWGHSFTLPRHPSVLLQTISLPCKQRVCVSWCVYSGVEACTRVYGSCVDSLDVHGQDSWRLLGFLSPLLSTLKTFLLHKYWLSSSSVLSTMGDTEALVHIRTYSLAMEFSQNIKYLMRNREEIMFFEVYTSGPAIRSMGFWALWESMISIILVPTNNSDVSNAIKCLLMKGTLKRI